MIDESSSGECAPLQPGARVGRYRIVGTLGEGGEAIVFRARDETLDRDVALKTPRREATSPHDHHHLLREARAASRLSHPNIVPIYEVFEDRGQPWVAMALVEGATLRATLGQRGALPPEDVVRYGEMLAEALQAAHAKHVLHRDVTPANIFITPDGRLLLADFGLARVPEPAERRIADTSTFTATEHVVAGTIGYMAPEQMLGQDVGPQSDVFSAGVVLYQMATGVRPFAGGTLGEVLEATLRGDVPTASARHPMPPELDRIIRKALARRLDERYASAADLAVDLRALHRRLVSGTYEHVAPNPRRRWRTRGVATAAVLGLSALAAWSWSAARPAGIPEATPHQVTSAAGWEAEAKISPDGREIVYAAEAPDGNVDIWIADSEGSSNPRRLTDGPALDRSPAWYPNGRGIVFASEQGGMSSVWRVGRLGTDTPTLIVENAREPAISPDGSRLAFTRPGRDGHQRILVASLDAVAAPAVLTTDADGLWDHEYPAWSPDGKTICYGGHTDLWKVGVASRRTERLTSDGEADYEPTWSPDGKWIYFTSLRGGTTAIWRIRASGGAPERVTLGSGPESQPSLSADGTRLSYSTFSATPNIAIRTLPAGHEYELGGGRSEAGPGLARDGSAVAYSSDSLKSPPDLYVQKLGTSGAPMGQARRLTEFPGSSTHPSFSPDGRWVAFYRVLDSQRDIWIVPVEGGEASRFTDDPAADYHPDWSPDGRQIAFVSERGGGAHLWSRPVKGGKADGPARRLTDGPSGQMAPSWSPDSSLVAFIATDDRQATEAWIVDVQRPLSTRQVTHGAEARRVGWMGDGTGSLLVSGLWGTGRLELRVVGIRDGRVRPVGAPGLFGHQDSSGEFSATPDGRLLAVERVAATGDVWVVTATRGRY